MGFKADWSASGTAPLGLLRLNRWVRSAPGRPRFSAVFGAQPGPPRHNAADIQAPPVPWERRRLGVPGVKGRFRKQHSGTPPAKGGRRRPSPDLGGGDQDQHKLTVRRAVRRFFLARSATAACTVDGGSN